MICDHKEAGGRGTENASLGSGCDPSLSSASATRWLGTSKWHVQGKKEEAWRGHRVPRLSPFFSGKEHLSGKTHPGVFRLVSVAQDGAGGGGDLALSGCEYYER